MRILLFVCIVGASIGSDYLTRYLREHLVRAPHHFFATLGIGLIVTFEIYEPVLRWKVACSKNTDCSRQP
jgi:hypothetical protein